MKKNGDKGLRQKGVLYVLGKRKTGDACFVKKIKYGDHLWKEKLCKML